MRVEVNGVRLFVEVDGIKFVDHGPSMVERPTVVLVHGGPAADHAIMKPFGSELSSDAQLVYYDHRGMGRSDAGSTDDWTLAQWADDLAGLIDALELDKPYIVGASFGGFVLQEFINRHPDKMSKAALLCTGVRSDPALSAAVFAKLGGQEAAEIATRFLSGDLSAIPDYHRVCAPLYSSAGMDLDMMARIVARPETLEHFFRPEGEWHQLNFAEGLKKAQCPTFVLHGALDPVVPLQLAREMFEALPADRSKFHVVEESGHGWFDKPEEWASELKTFLFGH